MNHNSLFKTLTRVLQISLIFACAVFTLYIDGAPVTYATSPITVNSLADTVDSSDGYCTLREAVNRANSIIHDDVAVQGECAFGTSGLDTIIFNSGLTGTIKLTSGQLAIKEDLEIIGPGADLLTVSGNYASRVFDIWGVAVAISDLTIAHGRAGDPSAGVNGDGGGIRIDSGTLTVKRVRFVDNAACCANNLNGGLGGAIRLYNASVTVTASTFENNRSEGNNGGAIFNWNGALAVENSSFVGNKAANAGGAIIVYTWRPSRIVNSTFTGNDARTGSAIYNQFTNSYGVLTVSNTTIADNSTRAVTSEEAATLKFQNTIIANNGVTNCSGRFTDLGNNLQWNPNSGCGTFTAADPRLAPLGDYGGFTPTVALLSGSAAIDGGADLPPGSDQRGYLRPVDGDGDGVAESDIGAYEAQLVVNSLADTVDSDDGYCTLREAVNKANTTIRDEVVVEGECAFGASGLDVIIFNSGLTGTINLTGGHLAITEDLEIIGPGTDLLTVSGTDASRVFDISSVAVVIRDLTIAHGRAGDPSAEVNGDGGGIRNNRGNLTVERVRFRDNTACCQNRLDGGLGGAIRNLDGTLKVIDSTFFNNRSDGDNGGALFNYNGTLQVSGSTFYANEASNAGGAVHHYSSRDSTIENSTFYSNDALQGSAIYHQNWSVLNPNSRDGKLTVTNVTISGNGSHAFSSEDGATPTVFRNTIIANNGTANCSTGASLTDSGNNLQWSPNSGCGTFKAADPKLAPLGDKGGPTATMALLLGSAAIDGGADILTRDQRGRRRTADGDGDGVARSDIGAYEVQEIRASDDTYEVREDNLLHVPAPGILSNDSGEGVLSIRIIDPPDHAETFERYADGAFKYQPAPNFHGTDSFTYRATNGSAESNTATVSITVHPINDPPVANDDHATTPEDTPVEIDVLANDRDADGDSLTISAVSQPARGRVTTTTGGHLVYTPDGDFFGTDSFTYKVTDGVVESDPVTVTLTVKQDPFTIRTTDDSGIGSLREAIKQANALSDTNMIIFDIPGTGPYTIQPASSLVTITHPIVIDATTQEGFAGRPVVELSGALLSTHSDGLNITAGNSTVRGLVINRFEGYGIRLSTRGGNVIAGNFIGTDVTGTAAAGNTSGGIRIHDSTNNIIGGTTQNARNIVSGNGLYGLLLTGGANENVVQGNFIGTDVDGTQAVPNARNGIDLELASNNKLGGETAGARNLISGNGQYGIYISVNATENMVQGNFIGTDIGGTIALPNRGGIISRGANNTIGGTTAGARNVISGNQSAGIDITGSGATGNVVQGNFIGTNVSGTSALPNDQGVLIHNEAANNSIGGKKWALPNVISGNNTAGILLIDGSSANAVVGNYIGTAADGTGELDGSSQLSGVRIGSNASNNKINFNVIADHQEDGVVIVGANTTGNAVHENTIRDNGRLGIDLGDDGVTSNDKVDADTGPNRLQNAPVLLSAVPDSDGNGISLKTRINSITDTTFVVEYFAGATCDPSGFGEGATFLGSSPATTDPSGNVIFTSTFTTLDSPVPIGHFVTATATDPSGNTSEFSQCVRAGPNNDTWPRALRLTLAGMTASTTSSDGVLHGAIEQYLDKRGRSRWYKLTVEPDSRLSIQLSNLPKNYDLTLYKDIGAAFNTLTSPEDLTLLSAEFAPDAFTPDAFTPDAFTPDVFSPDAFTPDAFTPDAFTPDAFTPDAFTPDAFTPDAFTPDAFTPDASTPDAFTPDAFTPDAFTPDAFTPEIFSSAQLRSLIGISAAEGIATERIEVNTWNNSGDFYVRVRGRNGAFDLANPFRLDVKLDGGLCSGISSDLPATSLTATSGDYETIILIDSARITVTGTLSTTLQTFATEVKGVIVDVSQDNRVVAANRQADAHPQCPYAKNLVAQGIKAVIDRYRVNNPLQYIVIIGDDNVIPFFRHADKAMLANEQNYVPPVRDETASQASLRLGYVLSQDRYGSRVEVSYKDRSIPVPDLAVGRLVETPEEITGMLEAYLYGTTDGVVTPDSALVTGYDFLVDAATAVKSELEAGLVSSTITDTSTVVDTLITPADVSPEDPASWTGTQLTEKLLGRRNDLVFLAGHFSAHSALAADYRTRLLTSDVAASSVDLENTIIFSVGCHSGYNLVDAHGIPRVTRELDWAQAFARKRATLIAGTGYQYGDTEFMEYSEQLYYYLSKEIRAGIVAVELGEALVAAKLEYLETTPQMRGIHEKALLEVTLFGLPMLKVDLPHGRGATAGDDTSIISTTRTYDTGRGKALGLQFADLTITPSLTTNTKVLSSTSDPSIAFNATYLAGRDGVVANPVEPVLPLEMNNVSVDGTVLRGVGFRGGVYSDTEGILPLTGAATTEIRGVHVPFRAEFFYPARPWNVNYFAALADSAGATRLAVMPAQFKSGGPDSLNGTLRQYTDMSFRLYYSAHFTSTDGITPALAAPPTISNVTVVTDTDTVTFRATVVGDPSAGIQEVWVTYTAARGDFAGRWQSIDLIQNDEDSTLWEATLSLAGTNTEDLRFMIQAVNGVGLVGVATNQGAYYPLDFSSSDSPEIPDSPPQPTELVFETPPASGAFRTRSTFTVTLTGDGTALANQPVTIGLGSLRRRVMTNNTGQATVTFPLFLEPGIYEVHASFAGTAEYESASVTGSFEVTKRATQINLQSPPEPAQYSDDPHLVATLTDSAGNTLPDKTLFFVISNEGGSYTVSRITDYAGRATVGPVHLPPGTYSVKAYFSGNIPLPDGTILLNDPRYLPSTVTDSLLIVREDVDVAYVGEQVIQVNTTLELTATLAQTDDDPGDLTLAKVKFEITDSNGNVITETAGVQANGIATATVTGLPTEVYEIRVTVTGEFFTSEAETALLAVYDPEGGFVTGGGWFTSPPGAYKEDLSITGKANFGFVSKYKKGATVPSGQTEFQFKAGDLNFHSSSYEWLVVAGARAQYKGSGTINDAGDYGFMLTAIDGHVNGGGGEDKVRVKIWNKTTGTVIYDNQVSCDDGDDADPCTIIGGGKIVIHD